MQSIVSHHKFATGKLPAFGPSHTPLGDFLSVSECTTLYGDAGGHAGGQQVGFRGQAAGWRGPVYMVRSSVH